MTDQHSFAYIEADIAAGLTIDAYRRMRTPRERRGLKASWLRISGGFRRR
jgi:hypothetical protein